MAMVDVAACRQTRSLDYSSYGGFPKLGVPFWGVPKIRIIAVLGLYWGSLIYGNYHMDWVLIIPLQERV